MIFLRSALGLIVSVVGMASAIPASGNTRIYFADETGKAISLTRSRDVDLVVEIDGAAPERSIYFDVQVKSARSLVVQEERKRLHFQRMYHPRTLLSPLKLMSVRNFKDSILHNGKVANSLDYAVDSDGKFVWKRKIHLKGHSKRLPPVMGVEHWSAQLNWNQGPDLFGVGAAKISYYRKGYDHFYEFQGPPFCLWQGQFLIESEYEQNLHQEKLVLGRSHTIDDEAGNARGADWATRPRVLSGGAAVNPNPMISNTGLFVGPFAGPIYEKIKTESHSTSVDRSWTLNPGEGGYFGSRVVYYRHPVIQFEVYGNKTTGWYLGSPRPGMLDVGARSFEFNVVPMQLLHDREAVEKFLDHTRQIPVPCEDPEISNGAPEFLVETKVGDSIYFYPK